MWGGRFDDAPAEGMREINASIRFDKRMWRQDIAASRAHVAMLGARGIVSAEDAAAIDAGLTKVGEGYACDGIPDDIALEDIHMLTEARLAGAMVATDFRLSKRDAIDARIDERVYEVLSIDASVASRTSFGGTAPDSVRAAVRAARGEET